MIVDARLKNLVIVLNSYPGIQTIMSCGGHKKPKIDLSQVPENEFYVEFGFKELYPSNEAWESLNKIASSISISSLIEREYYREKGITLEVDKDENTSIYFRIHGHDIEPDIITDILKEIQNEPGYLKTLKLKTAIPKFPKIKGSHLNVLLSS